MNTLKSHKDLLVYQKALDYVMEVYRLTNCFPSEEKYGLTSQLRRAAVSVPSNIAEGAARQSKKEWIQFLYISLGSLNEVETQLEIVERLGYAKIPEALRDDNTHLRRMLLKLINSIKIKTE